MKQRTVSFFIALAAFILFCSFNQPKEETKSQTDALASHIDSTVNPGDDFFLFANGKWFKEHPIPLSEQSNGIFQTIQDTINAQVRRICETSATITNAVQGGNPPKSGEVFNKQKIGDFFFSGMDSVSLNANGISGLKSGLDMIDGVTDLKGVMKAAAYVHTVAGAPLFRFGVGQDDRISSKNAIFIAQGGLSLPDRRYYSDTDERAVMIRQKFVRYAVEMFRIMGYDSAAAAKASDNLMNLETALAKASRRREDTRDPLKNYNKISFAELNSSTPDIDWNVFMNSVGLHNVDTVIVGQPEFLSSLDSCLTTFPLSDWKNYLKFHLINGLARYMDDKTFMASFNFYSTTLRGIEEPKPRWKRVVEQTNWSLGDLIGQVYVDEYLPKGTKEKLLEIGNAIKKEYSERIKALDWMSTATKEKALKKLNTIIMKVGYPDKWKDLSTLEVDRTSYLHNVMNANRWEFNYLISKYGKPVDRTEWDMEPQTYNAYYNPSNNEIVVPGCNIIVPGYEGRMADDAILYSIIGGSTFGHEITHGFDDQGSKYNAEGNLDNWWTPEDSTKFYEKTKMIVRQFDDYVAVDSLHINGALTEGENIADLGGIIMGYEAFKKTSQYKNNAMIAGVTPSQRFFLGYALAWMVDERPEAIVTQVKSNEHSPAKFRVIGPLSNMPEFYEAFGVKKGNAMWQPDSLRVKIW
ncbi:MAG: M13 family metallopeptidase [Bacteroidota bacterium]|nr:M13 family metallopeptidase [Bacteroidota bacterium]